MSDLVQAARKYIGCRFRHRGRGPLSFDCIGLVRTAMVDCGAVDLEDAKHYGREPFNDRLRAAMRRNFGEPVADMQVGDIVLMKFAREPHHVGILGDYLHGGLSLIHAHAEAGGVREHRLDATWQARILEVYRWAR